MAVFSIEFYSFRFNVAVFIFLCLTAKPIFSFAHQGQALDNNPNFGPYIALFGDARIENGGLRVHLTRPHAPSSGLMFLDKPFKFANGENVGNPTSFSTEFSFSMSPGKGDGLAFVLIPSGFQKRFQRQGHFGLSGETRFLGIEFDTKKNDKVGDLNANHVGIKVASRESVEVSNLSPLNLVLNNGQVLKSWIDYDSSSKILQVRLSKLNEKRPLSPIIAYRMDLLGIWGNEDVFVGIISTTNEESSQSINVYSWRFGVRDVSSMMHSMPADPLGYVNNSQEFSAERSQFGALTILARLIFVTGCGALLAFVMLFVWTIFASKHTVFMVECQARPEDFRYEKINVVVEKEQDVVKD